MSALAYCSMMDDAFEAIKEKFPNDDDHLIHDYLDWIDMNLDNIIEECNMEIYLPSVAGYAAYHRKLYCSI